MESFWSHNGAPDAWHFLVVIYFAFGILAARLFFDRFIFCIRFLAVFGISSCLSIWLCSFFFESSIGRICLTSEINVENRENKILNCISCPPLLSLLDTNL
ncbi:hypothetical protein L3X38_043787 [Prunus dulcis]|uniref:Uncharacterized protein n=1 Tax=Prunus dulcis TaxID=3755 RepID=A0AAD4UZ65_PRUDU|nr:hypothetical protein L3X38_043787 [Prunus dulcis]